MRTNSERAAAIEKRTGEIKQQRRTRQGRLAAVLSFAVCLVLIVGTALAMPGLMAKQGAAAGTGSGAMAGVFAQSSTAGYVLIGLLAFVLGCGVTILCHRLRQQNREEHDDRDH